jgi:hypothetical protein
MRNTGSSWSASKTAGPAISDKSAIGFGGSAEEPGSPALASISLPTPDKGWGIGGGRILKTPGPFSPTKISPRVSGN